MAQLLPKTKTGKTTVNKAEELLRETFKAKLPTSFRVLSNVQLYPTEDNWDDKRGEIDFIIVHPKLEMILLEVKGGSLKFNANTGRWVAIYSEEEVDPIRSHLINGW